MMSYGGCNLMEEGFCDVHMCIFFHLSVFDYGHVMLHLYPFCISRDSIFGVAWALMGVS